MSTFRENQHIEAGQVLYRLDALPFQLALQRADAAVGVVENNLKGLKANYQDMQAQIKQGEEDVDYYNGEFLRQKKLLDGHVTAQTDFTAARKNLQNAQQKLASLNHQLAAIVASLSGNPISRLNSIHSIVMRLHSATRQRVNSTTPLSRRHSPAS